MTDASAAPGLPLRRLLSTSAMAFAIMAAGAVAGLAAQLGTVRLIGTAQFGIYAYVIAWTTVLGYVSTLGFHISLLKLLPAYRVEAQWAQARSALRFALLTGPLAGLVVALVAAAIFSAVYDASDPARTALVIGVVAVPFMSLRLIGAAGIRAFGGILAAMAPERVLRDVLALALLAGLVLTGVAPPNAVGATVAMLGAAIILSAIVLRLLAATRPGELVMAPKSSAGRPWVRNWLRPVLPLTAIMLADTLLSRSGVLILGLFGSAIEAGVYAVAFSIALIAAMPRMAIAALFAPTVAALYAQGDRDGLQDLFRRATLMSLLATAAIAMPLVVGAPLLLSWIGSDFGAAQPILLILLMGQLVAAAGGPQQHLLTMTGHERRGAMLMAGASALSLVLGTTFYALFGPVGVAAAFAFSMAAWNFGMMRCIRRHLDIHPGLAVRIRFRIADKDA